MMNVRALLTTGLLGILAASASADEGHEDSVLVTGVSADSDSVLVTSVSAYLEEDAFNVIHGSDRNYTGGGAFDFSGRFVHDLRLTLPFVHDLRLTLPIEGFDWLLQTRRLYCWLDRESTRVVRDYSFSFGVTVFTPKDLRNHAPIPDDRPYSALDFLHVSQTSYFQRISLFSWLPTGLAVSSDLTLGMLGLRQGHDLQAWVHHTLRTDKDQVCNPDNYGTEGPPEPCGWDNQISNGGEPTILYGVRLQQLLNENLWFDWKNRWFDAKATVDGELGYYADTALGVQGRLGLINSPFWKANKAPLNYANQAFSTKHKPRSGFWRNFELYLWAGGRGRLVAYNALLERQIRRPKGGVHVDPKTLLCEFETGATLNVFYVSFTYAPFVGRSSDFVGDPERTHMWTSFFFSLRTTF